MLCVPEQRWHYFGHSWSFLIEQRICHIWPELLLSLLFMMDTAGTSARGPSLGCTQPFFKGQGGVQNVWNGSLQACVHVLVIGKQALVKYAILKGIEYHSNIFIYILKSHVQKQTPLEHSLPFVLPCVFPWSCRGVCLKESQRIWLRNGRDQLQMSIMWSWESDPFLWANKSNHITLICWC